GERGAASRIRDGCGEVRGSAGARVAGDGSGRRVQGQAVGQRSGWEGESVREDSAGCVEGGGIGKTDLSGVGGACERQRTGGQGGGIEEVEESGFENAGEHQGDGRGLARIEGSRGDRNIGVAVVSAALVE